MDGNLPFSAEFGLSLREGDFVTALATSAGGDTSEFSACVGVRNDRVRAIVPIPANARNSVAVNQSLNRVYVSGGAAPGQIVAAIDGTTFAVTEVGTGSGASVDDVSNRYWAGVLSPSAATVRDGTSDAEVQNVALAGGCAFETDVDPVSRRVWVGGQCGGGNDPVWAIDADTFAVMGPIGTGGVMGHLIVNRATGRAYIGPSGQPRRIHPETFAVTSNPIAVVIGVNHVTNRLYGFTTANGGDLYVIDGAPDPEVLLDVVSLPFAVGGSRIGVNTASNRLYISDPGGNAVGVVDAATHALIDRIVLGSDIIPGPIDVDSQRNRVHVIAATPAGHQLYVIEP
jgi:hypothetical protein